MSAVFRVEEPSPKYLGTPQASLVQAFDQVAQAPGGVARLRELIVSLAVQGRLVPEDKTDEPADALLGKVRREQEGGTKRARARPANSATPLHKDEQWFTVPNSWVWARLGDFVVSSEAGWSPSCIETPRQGEQWGVLKVSAVSWGVFDPNANKEFPVGLQPRPEYEVRDGDFLVSRANTAELVARSVVVYRPPPRLMLSDKIIRLHLSQHVDRAYVNLVNNSAEARNYYAAKASGTSSSMKNVAREVVLGLPLPLPPMSAQSRIVSRVDELMRLCDALEAKGRLETELHARLLSTLLSTLTDSTTPEELATNWQRVATHFDLLLDRPEAAEAVEATLIDLALRGHLVPQSPDADTGDDATAMAVQVSQYRKEHSIAASRVGPIDSAAMPFLLPSTWRWVRLDHVCTAITDGDHQPPPKSQNGIAFLTIGNLSRGEVSFEHCRYVSKDYFERIAAYRRPAKGDLLYTVVGSYGRPVVNRVDRAFCVQRHVAILKPATAGVDVEFLYLVLKSSFAYCQATEAITGTAQPTVPLTALRNYLVPLPPLTEQNRIVARVTELRRHCADLRQRLAAQQTVQSHLADALVESTLA